MVLPGDFLLLVERDRKGVGADFWVARLEQRWDALDTGRVVHADAQHHQAPVLVLAIELLQLRHLFLAGRAPGGPKVQQHRLAAKLLQLHRLAIGLSQLEVGRLFPRLGAYSLRRTASADRAAR